MHDFPPAVPDFSPGAATEPDTRSPTRLLIWLIRRQLDVLATAAGVGVLWSLPGAVGPFLVGRTIDEGIIGHSASDVALWSSLLLVVIIIGSIFGAVMHTFAVRSWLITLYGTTKLVTRKTTQMGHVLPRRTPTGEVLSVSSGDSDQFGALMDVIARSAAALVAYLIVAGIVLGTSVKLGVLVLVAAPVLVMIAVPLLKPLQRRQTVERSRQSDLTSMATDIVAGLRILRGIGGENTFGRNYAEQSQKVRRAGVSAGTWQAAVEATGVLFSGLFLVALTWLGAKEVLAGQIKIGQLISFFGYALFMVSPMQTFFELVQKWVRGLVSAHKAIAILEQQPPWTEPADPRPLPSGAEIRDEATGFIAPAGQFTIVVCAVPDESAALADRLGRYLPSETQPVSAELEEGVKGRTARRARAERRAELDRIAALDEVRARARWGVSIGGVDLSEASLAEVRRRVLVSDTASVVFSGTLQTAVDPHARLTREQAELALHTASAEDVYEALPGGWQGVIDERGRGLSGGQRQRLVLARVLAADPEILVLVEPTSAVDAHTEALIAERLAARRRGRTTIAMSVSPLLLHHADHVVLMADGGVVAEGTHQGLLTSSAAYRRVVVRAMEEAHA